MKTVDAETLRMWLEEGREVVVLDVRTAADRAEWVIPSSKHIDAYAALKANDPHALDGVTVPPDVPVVTVCGAGKISLVAAEQLQARGIEAYSLAGGMQAWSLAWNTAEVPLIGSAVRALQIRRTGKGCISYVLGSGEAAAVIDAALDPAVYQAIAEQAGWRITAVLDTHIHADHVSRSRALAEQTGATLYLPAQDRVVFPFTALDDGDTIAIGGEQLSTLRTPGHTAESTCYLLDERALFTGDTLFVGAVGRPDLHASPEAARSRAHALYTSLQRILTLPGETLILPGHTSAPTPFDGRPIAAPLDEVRTQTELLHIPEELFVDSVLARTPPMPPNHQRIIELNEAGMLINTPAELEAGANRCAVA